MRLAVAACLAAAALAAVPAAPAAVPGTATVNAMLRGIPQQGPWLGKKTARLTVVEYVDLQCPYCALFARQTLPPIIKSYVRTGRVRLLFRGLAFLGDDSKTALRWTFGAAAQNKLWNVLELLYRQQGKENSGWVTPRLLTNVGRAAGADLVRLRRDAARSGPLIAAAAKAAAVDRVPGTPYLVAGRSLMTLAPLRLENLDSRDLAAALDRLLR